MKTLNRRDFPGAQYPERIIQFGEGNFLRAFVDWQIDLLNEHTDLNSGVVVVRPIETSFPPSLSTQDGLYTTIIRGLNEKGEAVSDARLIRSVNREISVYSEYDEFLKLAHNPEMRFVFSNTTEAGISYHAGDKFDDAPAVSYPAKLTRLLFERFSHFNGALDKGWIIFSFLSLLFSCCPGTRIWALNSPSHRSAFSVSPSPFFLVFVIMPVTPVTLKRENFGGS